MDVDFYYSIEGPKRTQIKVKNSKFIASVSPIANKEEANSFLQVIRSEFFDATHNCFAYKLGTDGLDVRYSDDGEPKGTAGQPILFAINRYKFSNLIVVVTRYYGGTNLGKGGLARAYTDAAMNSLEICSPLKINLTKKLRVYSTYEDISIIKSLISEFAVSFNEFYTDAVEIEVDIPKSKVEIFVNKLTELTAARSGVMYLS